MVTGFIAAPACCDFRFANGSFTGWTFRKFERCDFPVFPKFICKIKSKPLKIKCFEKWKNPHRLK
jgi:hypothetical protein